MHSIVKPISVVLKEARQNKGISLEEAHKATKIHHNILRALEEGTTLGLSHVYVKSYTKIYAKYLEVNQKELDKHFQPAAVPKEKKVNLDFDSRSKEIKFKNLPRLPSLSELSFKMEPFKKVIIILVILFILFVLINLFRRPQNNKAVTSEKITVDKSAAVPKTEQKIAEEQPTKATEVAPSEAKDNILRLTILAKEDTWMQIKKDEEIVFKRILKKGDSESWQANENFDLWIANAGTVDLELNGKVLEPLGKRGQLLRSVVITKDGVVVKR